MKQTLKMHQQLKKPMMKCTLLGWGFRSTWIFSTKRYCL
ncbi:hypothetical protein CoNPh17_CDS0042 [Staphylococcus phage S-CoN_Ph17]|nr:hypothetical protein CoNPh17_CDS0042 [Staphylococcus phage S-CoN_Ph17]